MDSIVSRIPWSVPSTAALTDAIRDPKGLFVMLAVVVLVLYGLLWDAPRAGVAVTSCSVCWRLFPFFWCEKLPESSRSMGAVGLFIVLYALTFIILSRSMLKGRLTLGEISLWQVLVISVVQIGLLASICVSLVPLERGQQLLGPMHRWFGGQYPLWAWAVASLLIMPFMRSRRSRE